MNAGFPEDMARAFSILVVTDEDGELRLGRNEAGFYLERSSQDTSVDNLDQRAASRTMYESRAHASEAASDHLIRFLTGKAASSLEARGAPCWPLEAALENAVLIPLSASDGTAEPRAFRDVPGWTPDERPGAVDLIIDYHAYLRIAFELKLGAVSESLWDIVKLINLLDAEMADTAYVVVGAHDDEWAATPIGDLFNPDHVLAAFRARSRGAHQTMQEGLDITPETKRGCARQSSFNLQRSSRRQSPGHQLSGHVPARARRQARGSQRRQIRRRMASC